MKSIILWGIILICTWLMYEYPHVALNPGELTEGHQKLKDDCNACHQVFKGLPSTKCIACHKLSEIGRDTSTGMNSLSMEKKILFHHLLKDQECIACHSDHKGLIPGQGISKFSHEILSNELRSQCSNCHNKPIDSLHTHLSTACNNCHSTNGWKSSVVFKHDMIEGMDVNNCSSCHLVPTDDYHSSFKDNCNTCHSTDKWIPSTFDHANYFQLDKDHAAKCNVCHQNNNYKTYSCYGCHEHSQSKIAQEHQEEGIYNYSNCTECHKSADEHDIRRNGASPNELNQGETKKDTKGNKTRSKNGKNEKGEDEGGDDD